MAEGKLRVLSVAKASQKTSQMHIKLHRAYIPQQESFTRFSHSTWKCGKNSREFTRVWAERFQLNFFHSFEAFFRASDLESDEKLMAEFFLLTEFFVCVKIFSTNVELLPKFITMNLETLFTGIDFFNLNNQSEIIFFNWL